MYIYWGTANSGKRHIEIYADINNKTTLDGRKPRIYNKIQPSIIHRESDWAEVIYNHTIYHKNKRYNGLLRTRHSEHKIIFEFETYNNVSDINTKTTWIELSRKYKKYESKKVSMRKYLEEYSSKGYINSMIYYMLLMDNSEKICDPISPKMLNDNAEEIFDGVDNITEPNFLHYNLIGRNIYTEVEFPENVLKILRSAVNIVPYKTNLLDSVISKLDSFTDSKGMVLDWYKMKPKWIQDPIGLLYEMYENNKRFIWRYLDSYQTQLNYIIYTLTKNNIPYQMFNLDEDNYEDVYKGWDILLPKNITHLKDSWEGYEENYKKVEMMAKEYLSRRQKIFQTYPKKEPTYRMV